MSQFSKYNYFTARVFKTCEIHTEYQDASIKAWNVLIDFLRLFILLLCQQQKLLWRKWGECEKAHPCGEACLFLPSRNSCCCLMHAGMTKCKQRIREATFSRCNTFFYSLFSSHPLGRTVHPCPLDIFPTHIHTKGVLNIPLISPQIHHKTNRWKWETYVSGGNLSSITAILIVILFFFVFFQFSVWGKMMSWFLDQLLITETWAGTLQVPHLSFSASISLVR